MATPKLEFYRFKLNHKKEKFSTFRDFAIEELGGSKNITNDKAFILCSKYFIKSLDEDYAKDEKLKKVLTIIKKSVNRHLDKKPVFNSSSYTISGVINGGPYGKERINSDIEDKEDSTSLGFNKSILLYFYILVYLPSDHNEGFFMIHSNSSEETITVLFRNYISNLFKGKNYNKAIPEAFCPKSFQDEFRKGAVVKSMIFKTSFVENIHATDALTQLLQEYEIKIEATPKSKGILATEAAKVKDFFSRKVFGNKNSELQLDDFEQTRLNIENEVTNSQKTFEWNTKDNDFVPVVYLNGRITKRNPDGTVDFNELKELCENLFNDEIIDEIRPDLNVTKVK